MSNIPIIGAPPAEAVAAMQRAQEKALNDLFQSACSRARDVMRAQQAANHALIVVNSPENEVMIAGMGAAAIFAAQGFIGPVVQTFSARIEALMAANEQLARRVAELEEKLKP